MQTLATLSIPNAARFAPHDREKIIELMTDGLDRFMKAGNKWDGDASVLVSDTGEKFVLGFKLTNEDEDQLLAVTETLDG